MRWNVVDFAGLSCVYFKKVGDRAEFLACNSSPIPQIGNISSRNAFPNNFALAVPVDIRITKNGGKNCGLRNE